MGIICTYQPGVGRKGLLLSLIIWRVINYWNMMKATTYPGHQMKTRLHETVGLLKISVYSMQKHTSISKVLWIPLINCQI